VGRDVWRKLKHIELRREEDAGRYKWTENGGKKR
jgi:hypothetical protein